MIYRVGDEVRVVSEDYVRSSKKVDDGYGVNGLLFNYAMFKYCDKIFTIRRGSNDRYKLDPKDPKDSSKYAGDNWVFSSDMLNLTGIGPSSKLTKKLYPAKIFNEGLL